MASLDFYRKKENSIERHLDDARDICLAGLARMSQRNFEDVTRLTYHMDRLDLKGYVKASRLPTFDDAESVEEFKKNIENEFDRDYRNEVLHARIGPEEHERYVQSWDNALDVWDVFVADLRSRFVAGKSTIDVSKDGILFTKTVSAAPTVSRFNIKVPANEMPLRIVMDLALQFEKNSHILEAGFQMKSLSSEPKDRDGVIIYSTEAAFPHIVQVLRSTFRGNTNYHDRHADPAIFGGINLKDADGTNFPAIRVCAEPREIGADFMTFNDMQSTILSEALIAYVQAHHDGNKDMFVEDFYYDNDDANVRWNAEFPNFYNQAARQILGDSININNVAFFK